MMRAVLLFLGLSFVVCFAFAADTPQIVPRFERLQQLLNAVGQNEDDATLTSFVEFAATYDKSYASDKEMIYRLGVFKAGVAKAQQLTEESIEMGSTAVYGITTFSDLTIEEFKKGFLMNHMPPMPEDKRYPNYATPNMTNVAAPPSSFDWRNHANVVTGVYNQGQCGSCWAFSATENHESRFALQHHRGVESLSVQQILDCDDPHQYACNGGWPYQAWEYIERQGGQDRLSCYPYAGRYEGACHWNGGCNAANIVSWSWIFPHEEGKMRDWLYGNAPVSICVDASQWSYYNGGVVLGSQCGRGIDHCVLLTGWDMNNNPPYWNVRNSWGTGWGMNGYIALAFNENTCGMADYPASCHTCNGC